MSKELTGDAREAVDAKLIADKYIGRRGGKPKPIKEPGRRKPKRQPSEGEVTLPLDDYLRLRLMAEAANEFTLCEQCGAWLDVTEEGVETGDVHGCTYGLTGDSRYATTCRRYRVEWDRELLLERK